ncbi:MAG: HlyD family efflux transporter periplasmic adaptor subunit [Aquabacterium sp.]|uniref:HlyD family secretion protein n=1 Tax=Aquabacterium sp. TaxID=1872578 RepID=UPI0025B8F4DA|nr:HlyD family efflux transporter periplasmic adaptor subunit [Aquabacterium sp.]MBI5924026.1 HlyD family efflux transporter periplasmic adaptor subunit [Aquabacterium sp.]
MSKKTNTWLILAALTCVAGGVAWWVNSHRDPIPAGLVRSNGRLEVERIEIAAKYPGRIIELPVREGDVVKAGDLIARQDSTELVAQRAAVEAARQRAGQAMQRAAAETEVRKVMARMAQLELDHTTRLKQDALVSGAEVERRQAQRDGENAGVMVATAAIGEATAARSEAEAHMKRLDIAIDDMSLRAPVKGRIEYRVVEPGSVIPSGGRVATLLDTANVYMTVFLPTSVAGKLKVGDEARIVLDAATQFVIPARVSFVAGEAQFTPKYVETMSERDKLVYRVKLQVPTDVANQYAAYVKAGLTGYGFVRSDASVAWPAKLSVKLPPAEAASAAEP